MAPRIGFIIASCLKCLLSFSFILAFNDSDPNLQPLFYFAEEPGGIVYGRRGGSICLNCAAICTEIGTVTTITWRKDNRTITNTTRKYVLGNGTLCIERLRRPSDEGIYECLAANQLGTIVSPKVKLELTRISSVSIDPVNVSAVEGESVRFQCLFTGTPSSSAIVWENNGQSLSTDEVHRVTVLEDLGVLQIVNVTVKDEGQYRCIVANQTSATATLTVAPATVGHQVAVVLLGRPKDQDAVQLQTVVLECFINGLPAPAVTWTKEGSVLREHVHPFGSGNLKITEVDELDAGVYTCSWMRSPDDDHITSAQANVTVSVPPQLSPSESMLPYTVKRREQIVRLTCHFDGYPVPHVTWLKNGQWLQQTGRIKMTEGELSISPSRASDAGMYQCRAENKVGMDQAITLLDFESNVYAPWPPVSLVAVANKTSIRLAWKDPPRNKERNITAYCVHISQAKDDQEVQNVVPRSMQSGGSTELENLRPYTNYTMYVVAYNMHGGSDASRKLTVPTGEDVPVSFPLLQLVPLDSSSVRLNWKELSADQARGIVTEYRILYRKHGTQTYQHVSVRPSRTEYVLKGLEPNTKYDIMAAARTSAGYPSLVASFLPWVSCLTKGYNQSDVPDAPEMNAFAVEDAAIFVNWTAGNQSVPTLGYKLFCQISSLMENGEAEPPAELGPDATFHLFANLEPSTVYQLRLLAFNQRGESQASAQTVRTTSLASNGGRVNRPPLPSSFPVVEAKAINGSTISLRWKKPATLPNVAEYTVRYRRTNPPVVEANGSFYKYLKSLTENLVVGNLDPFTTYEFTVETRGSPTVRSQAVRCLTNEEEPSAPLDLDVTLAGSGAVHLQWNPPAKKNGIITKYLILYTPVQDWPYAHWFTKVENGTLLSTTVLDLRSSAVYYFHVQAATSAGYGPLSEIAYISVGAAAVGGLSDQDLGIVIGTSIGVTCIIICTCIIVLRNRCCPVAPVVMASAGAHVANGTVSSCHCHSVNCTAEFHVLHPSAEVDARDDSHLQLANVGLVENRHCDTKGGNVPNGRNPRFLGQKYTSQSPIVSPKEPPENHSQAVPLLEMDGRPHRSSEDILDLEGIDYEEDSEAEKVTLMHEGKRASYSRQDTAPANHDRLLGGNLPSRTTNHLSDGKSSSEGKVEEGEDPERNDYCGTQSDSDVQKGSGCNQEERSEGHYDSQCNGLVTNCKCHGENQDCSSHKHCDDSQETNDSIGDCNDPDDHCYGDRDDDVAYKELGFERRTCHDNHNALDHVLGCGYRCHHDVCEAEKSKNNNLVPRDISLASESITNWEPIETSCNRGNDSPPLVSNMVLIGTDSLGNLSKTLPTTDMVDNRGGDMPISMVD